MIDHKRIIPSVIGAVALSGCGGQQTVPQTLGDIDVSTQSAKKPKKAAEPTKKRSKAEIKNAYYDFLKGASEDDEFRVLAATRIAELELEGGGDLDESQPNAEAALDATVRSTIGILEKALRDFPNAKGNDHTLYQLAKAYGQVGEMEKANTTLNQMVKRYPATPYYTEAKFRIAENAFIHQDYIAAEDAYSEVLKAPNNDSFVEKSFFKRGWSRFKQELYEAALNDYYQAIGYHNFGPYEALTKSEKELSDEYFRAVGLSFAYLGGAPAITNYFKANPKTPYVYRTYNVVAELLLKQERYNDAVDTLQAYIDNFAGEDSVASAHLRIVSIWKEANFFSRYVSALEVLHNQYHPKAPVWDSAHKISQQEAQQLNATLREHIILLSSYYHNQYNKQGKQALWDKANTWYTRYLSGYKAFARQDKIYPLYAELLNKAKRYKAAFEYYELAAWDGDIVLDKESAYATVYLSSRLYQSASPMDKPEWLEKHLSFAFLYGQLYPGQSHTPSVVKNAVQLAFKDKQLERTIEIANILPDTAKLSTRQEVGLLKAQAYFDLAQYEDAEVMYQDLLVTPSISQTARADLSNKLALSIYKQAEVTQTQGDPLLAAEQFLRVHQLVPKSELAPTAVYDAIALYMGNSAWNQAINYLQLFKEAFPRHPYQKEVGKKLSVAYLNADRSLEAAKEFEKLSSVVTNREEKMAALWQAAELYHKKDELNSALRAYKEYARAYPRPYAPNMEAMHTVADIYQKTGDKPKRIFWLNKIRQADTKAPKSNKTERTQFIAATASFALATMRLDDFERIQLKHPLAKNLQRKKKAMQETVKFFGQSTVYGHEDYVTQSTHEIGRIYKEFAQSLLDSERPRDLNEEELEQYDILLEDQAFPFEDKAIEFYETNISRIAGGTYDDWIQKSLNELAVVFPTRYGRDGKVEPFIEQLP